MYEEHIMRKVTYGWKGGITIGGVMISNLRCADDTVLLTHTHGELLAILHNLETESKNIGINNNHSKTKARIIDRTRNIISQTSNIWVRAKSGNCFKLGTLSGPIWEYWFQMSGTVCKKLIVDVKPLEEQQKSWVIPH